MKEIEYTWWKTEHFYLGYLNDYPDYMTQGETKDDLIEHLKDLLADIESDTVPFIRHTEKLLVA
ncbi:MULTISPECIES: hypothetical protein [Methylomonas]|uniref:hypothetical protein n=1 Tax=Methylomonas TaxID=416 RepID=UPI0007C8AC77|nr:MULTISPECIES: hypothetical protein [Methylomonas]ANE54480.1 hypothetical protein AYM39_04270 [Methylomonas sp. DH-1]WNB76779.1 type II toxin-antitoxin system HicB family antitoxin [Methylomonas koyamae]